MQEGVYVKKIKMNNEKKASLLFCPSFQKEVTSKMIKIHVLQLDFQVIEVKRLNSEHKELDPFLN